MLDVCPKCGSEEYDTDKWSVYSGVPPFEDTHECCHCHHTWVESEHEDEQQQQQTS
jgi:hypothetical protein